MINKDGKIASSGKEQCEIISEFFKELFEKENIPEKPLYHPFTKEEISKVMRKLKNNKGTGIDNVNAELIKNGPEELHEMIANIFPINIKWTKFSRSTQKRYTSDTT